MSSKDTELIAALLERISRLEIDLADTRDALVAENIDPELAHAEDRASKFWFAMWRDAKRRERRLREEIAALREPVHELMMREVRIRCPRCKCVEVRTMQSRSHGWAEVCIQCLRGEM